MQRQQWHLVMALLSTLQSSLYLIVLLMPRCYLKACILLITTLSSLTQDDSEASVPRRMVQIDKLLSFWKQLTKEEQTEMTTVEVDQLHARLLQSTPAERCRLLRECFTETFGKEQDRRTKGSKQNRPCRHGFLTMSSHVSILLRALPWVDRHALTESTPAEINAQALYYIMLSTTLQWSRQSSQA